MKARIFRPTKSAMQSGRGGTRRWVLETEALPFGIDRLMGWTTASDTGQQVRLHFDSREAAVAYAEANGIDYEVFAPQERRLTIKSYADNFRYDRME